MPGRFENLAASNFDGVLDCTSDATPSYNCIAWAAGKTNQPWWPIAVVKGYHWPSGLPKDEETVANFTRAFETEGYEVCISSQIEPGFEKVAIYADADRNPLHAARSLPKGVWSSKIGDEEDIEHSTLEAVAGKLYGYPVVFLRRLIP